MPVTNSFIVEVDGQRLPAEVDLAAVLVEDHLHLPDSFSLTLRDASRKGLETSRATIGSKVSVAVLNDATSSPVVLIKGEVTALEAEIHRGTS